MLKSLRHSFVWALAQLPPEQMLHLNHSYVTLVILAVQAPLINVLISR